MSIDWMKTASKGKLRKHIYDKWIYGIDDTYPLHANIIKDMMNVSEVRSTIVFHVSDVCLEDDDVLEYEPLHFHPRNFMYRVETDHKLLLAR